MMTPEQRAAAEPAHEAHGGDESPDRDECPVCIEALDFFIRYGEYPVYDIPPMPKRLTHCTSDLGRHHILCARNGEFCSLNSFHSGPCSPHGSGSGSPRSLADRVRDRQVEIGLEIELPGWTEAEKREAYGR